LFLVAAALFGSAVRADVYVYADGKGVRLADVPQAGMKLLGVHVDGRARPATTGGKPQRPAAPVQPEAPHSEEQVRSALGALTQQRDD
jgi:hypothetical protein